MIKKYLSVLILTFVYLICNSCSLNAQSKVVEIPKDLKITLERTRCFGTCPKYILTINSDGSVIFEGLKFTDKIGKVESKINSDQILKIISEIKTAKFFELKDKYETFADGCLNATDHPSVILTIQMSEMKKTINHYLGCYDPDKDTYTVFPQQLYNLENKIDEIVETKRWIGEGK